MQQQNQPHSLQVSLHFDDMGLHNLPQIFELAALYIMLAGFADAPMSLCSVSKQSLHKHCKFAGMIDMLCKSKGCCVHDQIGDHAYVSTQYTVYCLLLSRSLLTCCHLRHQCVLALHVFIWRASVHYCPVCSLTASQWQ
jgi:hypothetical protein